MNALTPSPIPARLIRLPELARDLWWTWNAARDVFRRLDYPLWRQTAHNPVMILQKISPESLERAAADRAGEASLSDDHARTRATRRRALGGEDGDERGGASLQRFASVAGPVSHVGP